MEQSRVGNSMKNTIFGMVGMVASLLVQFISRTVFIKLLGDEFNGVNGLFTNILSVLNLAELGFASSIAFALYLPLQESNHEKVCAIMNYLRNVYYIIAIIVGTVGLLCVPCLQYLIKEDISNLSFTLNQIRVYFVLYLTNTVFSYIWSYKRTLITADQKNYLVSSADHLSNIILYTLQIIQLLIWKNYYLYLCLMLLKTIGTNLILTHIANKRYPFLKKGRRIKIDINERKAISKNVRAMFFHKFGGVAIYSTTTIIISSFVGLIEAGWYTNYLLIVNAVNSFISIIFHSITASVGNLCVTADKGYQQEVFFRVSYIANFLAIFTFVCYVVLFNHFMSLWVGIDKTFSLSVVVAISSSSMLTTLRSTTNTFKDAQGLFTKDWYKSFIEAIIGIGLGISFSYIWGILGVILGYIVGMLIALPIENIVLYKYGFKMPKSVKRQFLRILCCIIMAFMITGVVYFICSFLPSDGIGSFILKTLICISSVIAIYLIMTVKTKEFSYYKISIVKLLSKK